MSDYAASAKVFKAFCDENRLKIIDILRNGEKCAWEMLDSLHIGQSTLSHHMKILCESGVVDARKDGKCIYYSISETGRQDALVLLYQITELADKETITEE